MMVFYTGQTRFAHDIAKEQVDRTKRKENDLYLKKMHDMVGDAVSLISNESTQSLPESFGRLMHESWELKKMLSKSVSNSLIDDAYRRAVLAGAYGGKIAGAGGGGFLTLMVNPKFQDAVRAELKELQEVDFKFESQGSSIIYLK